MTGSTNPKHIGFCKLGNEELKWLRSIATRRWRRGRIVPARFSTFASNDLLDNGHFFPSSALNMGATAFKTFVCVVLLDPNTESRIRQSATGNCLEAVDE